MFHFLGTQNRQEQARVTVIPACIENNPSWKVGSNNGPKCLLKASQQMEFYDPIRDFLFPETYCYTAPFIYEYQELEEAVDRALLAHTLPVVLGGDHSVSFYVLRQFQKYHGEIGVVHFDAHADLRDEWNRSQFNHACALRRIRDLGASTVSLGVRSMSVGERDHWREAQVPLILAPQVDDLDLLERHLADLPEKLYVTFDLDAFDPSLVRAVGTPEPGGMSWAQVTAALERVVARKQIVGFDVVELIGDEADHASAFTAAKLVQGLLSLIFMKA